LTQLQSNLWTNRQELAELNINFFNILSSIVLNPQLQHSQYDILTEFNQAQAKRTIHMLMSAMQHNLPQQLELIPFGHAVTDNSFTALIHHIARYQDYLGLYYQLSFPQ
jgi:hypothetical protein